MKHIAVVEYGTSLGVSGARLVVKKQGSVVSEHALSRVKSVLVAKNGVSISSNCVTTLAARGIKLFFSDFKGEIVSCLYDVHSHGSVGVREQQFLYTKSPDSRNMALSMIYGKIRGQRTVLKYFGKYKKDANMKRISIFSEAAEKIKIISNNLQKKQYAPHEKWKESLMGYEGTSARIYWKALVDSELFPETFKGRVGRGAYDVVNKALNYGYAVLSTIVTNAIINAGLELYVGILHSSVPGKPALMLDVMEEYRAIVVDKAIIKIRAMFFDKTDLDMNLKKRIISEIYATMSKKQIYRKRNITLESILQRQMYRLAATFMGQKKYKALSYRW